MTGVVHVNDLAGVTGGGAGAGAAASRARRLHARLEGAVRGALSSGLATGESLGGFEVSITLVPAARMRALNRTYHGVDEPTDVLAFELGAPEEPGAPPGPRLLGDVYICPDEAAASAEALAIELDEELVRLAIHGVLHLLGHDHPEGEDRYHSEMFELQERLLRRVEEPEGGGASPGDGGRRG